MGSGNDGGTVIDSFWWKKGKGKTCIVFGPPDEIETHRVQA